MLVIIMLPFWPKKIIQTGIMPLMLLTTPVAEEEE